MKKDCWFSIVVYLEWVKQGFFKRRHKYVFDLQEWWNIWHIGMTPHHHYFCYWFIHMIITWKGREFEEGSWGTERTTVTNTALSRRLIFRKKTSYHFSVVKINPTKSDTEGSEASAGFFRNDSFFHLLVDPPFWFQENDKAGFRQSSDPQSKISCSKYDKLNSVSVSYLLRNTVDPKICRKPVLSFSHI